MDSIDEIEAKNNRNLETAELVSNYMRTNAQRAAQMQREKANAEVPREADLPRGEESDKLDFSSEFTTGDMGLNQQGTPEELLAWKRQIEEEDEERRRRESEEEEEERRRREAEDEERRRREPEDEEEERRRRESEGDGERSEGQPDNGDEQPEEWKGGGWAQKQPDPAVEQPSVEQGEAESENAWTPPPGATPLHLRPAGSGRQPQIPLSPTAEALPSAVSQAAQASPRTSPLDDVLGTGPAQQFWSDSPAPAVSAAPASPPPPLSSAASHPAFQERLRPAPEAVLPATGQLAGMDPALAQLARSLIMNAPGEAGYEECARLLARFGVGALRMCSREKVKVEILDESGFATHSGLAELQLSPDQTPCDGAYLVRRRLVLVDRRCLLGKPRYFHPALYYFAHAFDHAQGGETFSSRKAAAVVACFEASTRAFNGFDFVDELAAADPVRYFARAVAVYLGRDDCSDPLWSHQDLHDFDRSMYDYLQYLFARLGS